MAKHGKMLKWRNNNVEGPSPQHYYVQYVEDFKFWALVAGYDECSSDPEKEIVKIFVSGLKPEVFREEIYSRVFETRVEVIAETRHELANYRDIIEISERI